jgi:predicted DNA-binding transcriptional regulator YafY
MAVARLGRVLMPRAAGRDQPAPMERLVRLIGALTAHSGGAPAELLLTAVDPPTEAMQGSSGESHDEARRKMLTRDLEHLNALGYDVRNVADVGSEGRYVMRARDNRLQVSLTAQQRGELLRAALAAGLDDMARHLGDDGDGGAEAGGVEDPDSRPGAGRSAALDLVQRATARRCRVRFTYKGESRALDPARVHSGPSGWYLSGRETGIRRTIPAIPRPLVVGGGPAAGRGPGVGRGAPGARREPARGSGLGGRGRGR